MASFGSAILSIFRGVLAPVVGTLIDAEVATFKAKYVDSNPKFDAATKAAIDQSIDQLVAQVKLALAGSSTN